MSCGASACRLAPSRWVLALRVYRAMKGALVMLRIHLPPSAVEWGVLFGHFNWLLRGEFTSAPSCYRPRCVACAEPLPYHLILSGCIHTGAVPTVPRSPFPLIMALQA